MVQISKITGFLGLLALALLAQPDFAHATTLGGVIDNVRDDIGRSMPGVYAGFSYFIGIILGFMGILKLKEHVENPNQVNFFEPIKRFGAGGCFFALPVVIEAAARTISGEGDSAGYTNDGFSGASSGVGLDAMIVKLMSNVFEPLQYIFLVFGYLAGILLVMVGISRLLKAEQDGPRGPAGIGTLMTFLMAGCLFSLNAIISYFTTTMFGDSTINTNGVLSYTQGLGGASAHVHAVISAIIAFSIILGWVSLIRGVFIIRGVSEGNSQASMMAAITHLIGGALAINLGSVIMAVQETLGITQYGIVFGGGGGGGAAP